MTEIDVRAFTDAFRDMDVDGYLNESPTFILEIFDIIDPIISNGMTPSRFTESGGLEFINCKRRVVGLVGALVLGLGWEEKFKSRWAPDLTEALCSYFGFSENFLNGLEAGFEGWTHHQNLPDNLLSRDFKAGYAFGVEAWATYLEETQKNQ